MNKKLDEDDYETIDSQVEIFSEQISSNIYTAFIDKGIGEPSNYRRLFHILRNAGENDIVRLHINTHGGMLSTGIALMNAILGCRAKTIGIVDFEAISAGTLPIMACDDVIMMPGSYIMIHHASFGTPRQTVSQIRDYIGFTVEHLDEIIENIYEGFLTEEEIYDVIENNKELYIKAEEVEQRLKTRMEYFDKKYSEENLGENND